MGPLLRRGFGHHREPRHNFIVQIVADSGLDQWLPPLTWRRPWSSGRLKRLLERRNVARAVRVAQGTI